ncbi:hypothetical protein O181_128321 [Austropuccinia psidii MF-1]|uniref:Vacuolar protein sorting-associated protein 13 VPS13 adaptor binding domain-containing protein n=1 Tax=Austropuccinia psidii MF-1 TaxID=1389203 RepID=A0A9Q3Q7K4_9BASI|nr:hypothetical protein [Austropuccinia psidii MF-1]
MEAWPITFKISCLGFPSYHSVALESERTLEMNIIATFIDLIMTGTNIWGWEGQNVLHHKRGMMSPYLIKNLTGYPLKVLEESEDKFRKGKEYLVEDGKRIPWQFKDWKLMRESVMSPTQSKLRIVLDGARWEAVSGISVVRESDEVYPLRPSLDEVTHCLLCDVAIQDTVNEVTFWSTFQVQNNTSLPIEMCVVDDAGSIICQPYNIVPGSLFSVPIEAAYHQRIKIWPDHQFSHRNFYNRDC